MKVPFQTKHQCFLTLSRPPHKNIVLPFPVSNSLFEWYSESAVLTKVL